MTNVSALQPFLTYGTAAAAAAFTAALVSTRQRRAALASGEAEEWPEAAPLEEETRRAFMGWYKDATLPAASIVLTPKSPTRPYQSRLGGSPWMPFALPWPRTRAGEPLNFVAQINLEEVPPMSDFPEHGILLFFIAPQPDNNQHHPLRRRDDSAVIYIADPRHRKGSVTDPPAKRRVGTKGAHFPFRNKNHGRKDGHRIMFRTGMMKPSATDWQVAEWRNRIARADQPAATDPLGDLTEGAPTQHFVGGYACFRDEDIRSQHTKLREYDRTLLSLWSDDLFDFGPHGHANFMIRQSDLRRRDFSDTILQWDTK